MKIFCKFPTVNISKLNFWLVICIAKNFIWTTLKVIFSIFRFFCTLRFQIYKYCPIITNHTSMESLFIQMMYKSQFHKIDPYDWFCAPGSHLSEHPSSSIQPSLLSKNCTYPEWAKGLVKSLWTLTSSTLPHLLDATELWAPEQPDTGTVSSPKQSISWTPDINVEHTTLLYNYLFTTHTYIIYCIYIFFPISNLHMSDLYTHACLYCIVFLLFCTLPICILFFCCLCPVSVTLWSFCHYNTFLVCVNIPGNKAHSDLILISTFTLIDNKII